MRGRLYDRVALAENRLVLLAPPNANLGSFTNASHDPSRRNRLLRAVQRMRGAVYLEDGAIGRQHLSPEGLHQTAEDDRSWHLLLLNAEQRVTACIWYLQHALDASFDDLRVRNSPLAWMAEWRDKLWHAVESELGRARAEGLRYAEIGGWAVTQESRRTSEAVLLALAAFSLGRQLGGALGMTTATVRHSSSAILRRLGGTQLRSGVTDIPSYFDPKYGCTMELLRFDSRDPNARYSAMIEGLRQRLRDVPVIAAGLSVDSLPPVAPETVVRSLTM